ncbi:hypothetical protein GJ496_010466 [Pomphorhynchus laevis]|nr:hypothetical protein GJ496_010466 [Pomphorhynchus laevis]
MKVGGDSLKQHQLVICRLIAISKKEAFTACLIKAKESVNENIVQCLNYRVAFGTSTWFSEFPIDHELKSTYRLEVGGDSLRQHQLVICRLIAISKKEAFTACLIKAKESVNENIVQCLNYSVAFGTSTWFSEFPIDHELKSAYRLEVGEDSLRQHPLVICRLIAISKKEAFTACLIKAKESVNENIVQCLNYSVAFGASTWLSALLIDHELKSTYRLEVGEDRLRQHPLVICRLIAISKKEAFTACLIKAKESVNENIVQCLNYSVAFGTSTWLSALLIDHELKSTYRLEVGGDSLRQHQLVICRLIAISKKEAFKACLIKAKESVNENIVQCLNYSVACGTSTCEPLELVIHECKYNQTWFNLCIVQLVQGWINFLLIKATLHFIVLHRGCL